MALASSSGTPTGGSLEQIVVGMISIGIAGYLSSSAIERLALPCHGAVYSRSTLKQKPKHSEFELPEKFHGNSKI